MAVQTRKAGDSGGATVVLAVAFAALALCLVPTLALSEVSEEGRLLDRPLEFSTPPLGVFQLVPADRVSSEPVTPPTAASLRPAMCHGPAAARPPPTTSA